MSIRLPKNMAQSIGGGSVIALLACLWFPVITVWWPAWMRESSLSHGPLLVLLTVIHLSGKRAILLERGEQAYPGLLVLTFSCLIYLLGFFIDLGFLKSVGILGITTGILGVFGGTRALKTGAGALGLMLFAIPWPMTFAERLAFPLQLTSSTYAALFGGMLGIPIHREGVFLSVVPHLNAPPIYTIMVAQACSGLTSLTVLFALGYLMAYYTPVGGFGRSLFLLIVPVLALLANAVRLTLILVAGAYINAKTAQWIHDNEAPVLILFCSLGFLALRHTLLAMNRPSPRTAPAARVDRSPTDFLETSDLSSTAFFPTSFEEERRPQGDDAPPHAQGDPLGSASTARR